jgi:hypothetical protein
MVSGAPLGACAKSLNGTWTIPILLVAKNA